MAAQPDQLRDAAARLIRVAAELPACLVPVAGRLGPEVWSGLAAARFRGELVGSRVRLGRAADDLEALAAALVAEACRLEDFALDACRPVSAGD
ncbi:hypothetical protein BH20ACT2_BH20ACT2_11640 [soil metagenome]